MNREEELYKDFENAVKDIDFSSYNPGSKSFMKALNLGLMWWLIEHWKLSGIEDEINGAKEYLRQWKDLGVEDFKRMAYDEVRHAEILIRQKRDKSTDPKEHEMIENYEKELNEIKYHLESKPVVASASIATTVR